MPSKQIDKLLLPFLTIFPAFEPSVTLQSDIFVGIVSTFLHSIPPPLFGSQEYTISPCT